MRNGHAVRVKICGISRRQDAEAAARAGADAIGLNFFAGPRRIDVHTAADILGALPPMCTPVALVDVTGGDVPQELREVLGRFRVCHLQLYGKVTSDTLARLRADSLKPIVVEHVLGGQFPDNVQQLLSAAAPNPPAAILLDAHREGLAGGTGTTADWNVIAAARQAGRMSSWPPVILAGGLTPDNVAQAITTVRPWGVDVSSGVESSVCCKDHQRMAAFTAAARRAACG